MPSILLAHFASLLRRWITGPDRHVSSPHRCNVRDRSLVFRGGDAALRPAFVRVRREGDRR
jgi:hypothetical protein